MAVDEKDQNANTILHFAARGGFLDVLKEAIDKGANMNARTIDGATPLYEAADYGQLQIVRELVERGAVLDHEKGGCRLPAVQPYTSLRPWDMTG